MIDVIDATEIIEPEDADEALALHIRWAQEGEEIHIHGLMCRTQSNERAACTCEPTIIRLGPKA